MTMTLEPVFCHPRGIRFLTASKNPGAHWTLDNPNKNNGTCICFGLAILAHHRTDSLHSLGSLRSGSVLSYLPLRSLFQPRSPHLRSPVSSMTSPQNNPDRQSSQSSSTKTVRFVIKGIVQGVFYRDWTVENATQLGLKGWVRNKRDGSVEALFSGDPDKIQEIEQRCRRGPSDAVVTGLQVFPCNDDPGTGFERRPTV
uniref:acylphosphatase n=1 Tax=Rhizophora mucronata TaxID=61149 RepID=A0A2P2IVQ8_RHIMU